MTQILSNQIEQVQISTKNSAFIEFILAIQQDNVDYANLFQTSEITKFPDTPIFGGMLKTRKGCYEAIYTDATPEVGKWRRITDNVIYNINDTIPSTL